MPKSKPTQPAVKIDEGFAGLLIPHRPDELDRLRRDIKAHGCLSPLIVWGPKHVLLDGHARHALCRQLGIPYRIERIKLSSRAAAKHWIVRHQLARRNLGQFQRDALARPRAPRRTAKKTTPAAHKTDYHLVHKIKRVHKSRDTRLIHGLVTGDLTVAGAYDQAVAK